MTTTNPKLIDVDLFGNVIIKDELLRDRFIEPPFSILDTKTGNWQKRKRLWLSKGLKSEVGRDSNLLGKSATLAGITDPDVKDIWNKNLRKEHLTELEYETILPYLTKGNATSVFDPALCEVLYNWFCDEGGRILDPFAGGSVRGIVANYLGYKYTGIDIREEQINSNREQALQILPVDNQPQWYCGDSNEVLDGEWTGNFDLVLSCPPYADLEVYSNLSGDISNKPYKEFLKIYESIIYKSCRLLKSGGYACFVVGEVRDKNGYYIGFVPDTITAFQKCGLKFYNEAILLNAVAGAGMRAAGNMKKQKLVKVHQNILIFKKP